MNTAGEENAAPELGQETEAGPGVKRGSALVEALVVLCVEHLKAHGRLEKEAVMNAFNNATGAVVGPVPPEAQARVWIEVRRRLERIEGVDLVALEQSFFGSPAGHDEGPIGKHIAAKYVVAGEADEDLSREDDVAAGFAVVKPEKE